MIGRSVAACFVCLACSSFNKPIELGPVEKCNAWVESYCKRTVNCGFYFSVDQCKIDLNAQNLDCSQIVSVTASYETCMTDTKAQTCLDQLSVPSSCSGVFQVP